MANLSVRARTRGRLAPREGTRELLVFTLAGEPYAVQLDTIREIISPPPITLVPRAARDVLGVCSVRGLLVTVVDLRRRLSLPERPVGRKTRILLSSTGDEDTVGLLVDEVKNVVRLADADMEVAQTVLGGEVSEHVMAIARPDPETVLVLLDIGSVARGRKETAPW